MNLSLFESRKIRGNYRITIPEQVGSLVGFEHPVYGKSIQWHVDNENRVAVLSRSLDDETERIDHRLRSQEFIPLKRTDISMGLTITLIKEVRNRVDWKVEPGDSIYFIANSDMINSDIRNSVYIIDGDITNRIVERGVSKDGKYDEILSKVPK